MLGLGNTIPSNAPIPEPLILGVHEGAAAAYSFRKLLTSYSGPCVRVKNDSGTELDIGFVSNYVDLASIASHCGSGGGKISIWYDQSGNGRDASQTADVRMPLIFASGSHVQIDGGYSAARFTGSQRLLTASAQLHSGFFYTTCVIRTNIAIGDEQIFSQDDAQSSPQVRIAQYLRTKNSSTAGRSVVFNLKGDAFGDDSTSISTESKMQISALLSGGFGSKTIETFDDSVTNGSTSVTGVPQTGSLAAAVGAAAGALSVANAFNGHIAELLFWGIDKSNDRVDIEADVDRYYQIT